MSNTRERVLTAVRSASEAMPTTSFSRNYRTSLEPSDSILELFIDRLLDYRATVIDLRLEVDADKIRTEIEAVLAERDIASVAVPVGLPDGLRPTCVPVVEDRGLTNSELDVTGASLTESAISVALSGTILLDVLAGSLTANARISSTSGAATLPSGRTGTIARSISVSERFQVVVMK